jgi:hypothetical protein
MIMVGVSMVGVPCLREREEGAGGLIGRSKWVGVSQRSVVLVSFTAH